MQTKTAFVVLAALAAAAGCGSSGSSSPQVGTVRASLHRAKGCGDLLADLKADASYKVNKVIDLQIKGIQACQAQYPDAQCAYGGYAVHGERGSLGDSAGGEPTSSAAPSPKASGSDESAQSYSETNTQVKGVDEADIVKNDGKYLYVLHGRAFKVVNAWPASDLKEASSIDIEGTPDEMFVSEGKVVVYSQVNGASLFAAAGVTPKQRYNDYVYGPVGTKAPVAVDPATSSGGAPQPYAPLTKITVLTLDGTTPTVAREVYFEGSYLDARRVGPHVRTVLQSYEYGPQLKYGVGEVLTPSPANGGSSQTFQYPETGTAMISALEQLRSENLSIIAGSQLEGWLPYTFVRNGGAVSAQTVACEDFYVPTAGSTEGGLTEVASIDLSNPAAPPRQTAILGQAQTVYGNADTLYLAASAWSEPPFVWSSPISGVGSSGGTVESADPGTAASPPPDAADAPAPAPAPGGLPAYDLKGNVRVKTTSGQPAVAYPSSRTHLHKFEFKTDAGFPNYVASGTVVGQVKDQFSLDEKDNQLRIATTEDRVYVTPDGQYASVDGSPPQPGAPAPTNPATVNHVFVLSQDGPWLDATGDVGELAPNERIYSVRFLGQRGYVTTFRQVDPLFVVDLSAPATPKVLAALKIPGFSEYMHPLDENHLLTIGRNADANGRQQGLQLRIFDVTNGASPVIAKEFTYTGDEYGSSEAEYDHKAFTFFEDKGLLAFPYYSYGSGTNGGMRSSLELFKVDLASGFTKLGSIDHTALLQSTPQGYCSGYYRPSVRRGVFLESFVYSVSYGGIVARDTNDLAAAGAEIALPAPQINEGYGPACAE
jgi:hypothetical protein